MRKITTIAILGMFTFTASAVNGINKEVLDEEAASIECKEHVAVDCDGDGSADYEYTINCEYAEALKKQYEDSCG